jgi:hypothetical protein
VHKVQVVNSTSILFSGSQLHQLFVTLLTHCHPASPVALWNEFKEHICDDLAHRIQREYRHPNPTQESVCDYGLFLIDQLLLHHNTSLSDFPEMPTPQEDWTHPGEQRNRLIRELENYDPEEEGKICQENLTKFTPAQHHVFDQVVASVDGSQGKTFFLSAAAGCGKTFVANTLCHHLRSQSKIVLCVASSGVASLLLIGGHTVHSRFKVPITLHEGSVCSISKNSDLAKLLKETSLIIQDEAPMQHRHVAEAVDKSVADARDQRDRPFGGVTVVFCGDWHQCLPVIPQASRQEIVNACLFKSRLWRNVTQLRLTENMCLQQSSPNVQQFAKWLLEVGDGNHTTPEGTITIPPEMRCGNSVSNLFSSIYPLIHQPQDDEFFAQRTILTSRNTEVQEINTELLKKFPGEEMSFPGVNSVQREAGADAAENLAHEIYPPEYLAFLTTSGLPLSDLRLKLNAPIMLLRNLSPAHGLCNGTRAVITQLSSRVLQVRIISGDHKGQYALIPRITLNSGPEDFPFTLSRHQFPVHLAFCQEPTGSDKNQGRRAEAPQQGMGARRAIHARKAKRSTDAVR